MDEQHVFRWYLNSLHQPVAELQGSWRCGGTEGCCPPLETSNNAPVLSVLLDRQPEEVSHAVDWRKRIKMGWEQLIISCANCVDSTVCKNERSRDSHSWTTECMGPTPPRMPGSWFFLMSESHSVTAYWMTLSTPRRLKKKSRAEQINYTIGNANALSFKLSMNQTIKRLHMICNCFSSPVPTAEPLQL